MALNEGKLSAGIEKALINVKENALEQADSAAQIAQAVVDYAADAEIMVTAPWIMTSTGAPDPSVTGLYATSTNTAGQAALEGAIVASFAAGDNMALFAAGMVAYTAASFIAFASGANNVVGAAAMVPPNFSSAMKEGEDGADEATIAAALAKEIHGALTKAIFNGAGVGPASAGPVAGVTIE